jgi:hypothetical protein
VYAHAVIETRLSAEDAEGRLSALVCRPLTIHQWLDDRQTAAAAAIPFAGRISNGRFKFSRVITGRNSFVPVIIGQVVSADGGAQLQMTFRLHIAVALFELLMFVAMIDDLVKNGFTWEPFVIMVFILAMTLGFFLQEKRRAIVILRREFGTTY